MDSNEIKFDPGVYQNQPNQINHKKHITTLNYFSFFNTKKTCLIYDTDRNSTDIFYYFLVLLVKT